jgi:hypothetical protein
MLWLVLGLTLPFAGNPLLLAGERAERGRRFEIAYEADVHRGPLTGRLLVIVATTDEEREPRFAVDWSVDTAQIFGRDVADWRPGETAVLDGRALGHPVPSLSELPGGTHVVQAVLHVYETFSRADGHVLLLPADDGEGQQWESSPGNLYSKPQEVAIGAASRMRIELTEVIPPIEPPADTELVRHFRMVSPLLSEFWGRPVSLGAVVIVPPGFDDTPDARYPVLYQHGHFAATRRTFEEKPPGPEVTGRARERAERRHALYREWTSGRLPKILVVLPQHPTPYYDDSYGVDSANAGPYGRAMVEELYPAVERAFRAIGAPWARVLAGGSTGGWISLAQQIFHPEYFGGAWGWCPDPVDFHAFQLLDLYDEGEHAFWERGPWKRMPHPVARDRDGQAFATVLDFSRQELVLGERGRSGGQLDAFHATFGPVGNDGYPAPLWDPRTGEIDPAVARHWRERHDLTAHLERSWSRIGSDLVGKLHVTMGTKDTYFLEGAVERLEKFLESTKLPERGPDYAGSVAWGDNEPHCYTGTPDGKSDIAHWLPIFAEHMRSRAPEGADVESWAASPPAP